MVNSIILGVRIHPISRFELHKKIYEHILDNRHEIIAHANIQGCNLAYRDVRMRNFLNNSSLVFCDGFGIKLAASLLGHEIPERITYADWMWQLAEFCQENQFSLYFLGGRPGIAEKAAINLKRKYPALAIAGTHHGYFDKTPGSAENEAVLALINQARPDILIVGFGMPLQEYWLEENWARIDARVALTAGAAFDYISGQLRRAPRWMTDHGLEWLGRLLIEPHRLWKRYIFGIPLFFWRILLQRLGLLRLPPHP